MPLWGNTDSAANNTALYGNVSVGVFSRASKEVVGQWAVSSAEMANTAAAERKAVAHDGWVLRKAGTGPVTSLAISVGGTGFSNTDLVKVSGGTVNAAGSLVTNSTGGITNVTLTNPGAGFINASASTIAVTNATGGASAGSGQTLTFTLGGRSGRVHYETIVAMDSISSTGNTIPFHT